MNEYRVKITETLSKYVTVQAETPLDARDMAEEKWRNGTHYLDAEDFTGVRFLVTLEREKGYKV